MTEVNTHHNKLRSGIILETGSTNEQGSDVVVTNRGTLSGLARRKSDGAKVLVTNLHIITGSVEVNPEGGELVYHHQVHPDHLVGTVPVRTDADPSWSPIHPPGTGDPPVSNPVDAAYCLLNENVPAEFVLHDHPTHTERKVLSGTVEPMEGDELIILGSRHGERRATVTRTGFEGYTVDGRRFHNVVLLRIPDDQPAFVRGESGSPVLSYDQDKDEYRMSCVAFAFSPPASRNFEAFPASVVEKS